MTTLRHPEGLPVCVKEIAPSVLTLFGRKEVGLPSILVALRDRLETAHVLFRATSHSIAQLS